MPVHTQGSLLGGRYRVLRHLGSGGMASVLLCQDERLDRLVAVKRLHADSPIDVEQRFVREAKLGASLNHPNLVSVFDTAIDDEGVLIVMEYVEGEALARTLRRGPLEPERVARMARDLGEALDHAHAHGVVHRDVKPGNVLLRRDGVTKLVDLGIATAADQTRITRSGIVLGTAAYMAPEQLEGRPAGPAADVYALAVVCFEALAGQRARPGRTPMEIAHAIATEGMPDVREHVPGLPAAVALALRRGMAREAADRPSSAGALADELARGLERGGAETAATRRFAPAPATTEHAPLAPGARPRSGPAGAPLPSGGPRSGSAGRPLLAGPTRPRRRGAVALALALLALAASAVVFAVMSGGGDGDPQRAESPQQSRGDAGREQQPRQQEPAAPRQQEQPAQPAPGEAAPESEPPPESEPAPEEQPASADPAGGAALNDQGFALMQQGDFDGAVPILQRAVSSWPQDSREITYAYALFNLGKSLNRSGRPDEAIPYLEKRLTWDDQRAEVEAELALARRNAGQG